MNPLATFARRLRSGPPQIVGWTGSRDSLPLEIMLRAGCDGVVIDVQHGMADLAAVDAGIQSAGACGKPVLVRMGLNDVGGAARCLDFGAAGVIIPMVNSADEARALVRELKFAPLGQRSYGPIRAANLCGLTSAEYFAQAHAFTLLFVMIETAAGLAAVAEILAVEGVDGVLVGPNDLCIALTEGAVVDALHPKVDAALDVILAATKKAGKLAAAFCPTAARAGELAQRGFNLVSLPTEPMLLRAATQAALAEARAGL